MDLRGKRIVITGASSGIGEELARQLAAPGTRLALGARRVEKLEQVAAECRAKGAEVLVVATDVAKEADCRALVARAVDTFGGLDALVANAGISMYALFEEITDLSIFQRIMEVNYLGAVYCTHAALPHLKRSRGAILAVSSLVGKTGVPTRTAYSASKHAMHGFFDSLRAEVGHEVQITIVCPGFVETEIRERALGTDGNATTHRHDERASMSVAECVRQMLGAMREGRRERVLTWRGRLGSIIRPFAPGLVDRMARRQVGLQEP